MNTDALIPLDSEDRPDARVVDRLSIGRFARLTGLSIGALRHYDELDLLRPVEVDRFTGYRRYAADQVEIGRAIARLPDLEVPLEEIRAVLATDDPAEQRRRVVGQAARVQARVDRQVRILHVLRQLSQGRERVVTAPPRPPRPSMPIRIVGSAKSSTTTPGR